MIALSLTGLLGATGWLGWVMTKGDGRRVKR